MTQPTSDIRTLLLAALGLGEWEAEHLAGVDLVRQVVELLAWYRRELHATMVRLQRLAIDAQELQSGEAWDQMREQMAEVEAENRQLRTGLRLARRVAAVADAKLIDAPCSASAHLDEIAAVTRLLLGDQADGWGDGEVRLRVEALSEMRTASTGGPLPMVLDGED